MYGRLCSTAHPSDTIWTIPDLENEIKCQVRSYSNIILIRIFLRMSVLRQQAAATSCSQNSRQGTQNVSFFGPAMPTLPTPAPPNQTAWWQFQDQRHLPWLNHAAKGSRMSHVRPSSKLATNLMFSGSRRANKCAETKRTALIGRSTEGFAFSTATVEPLRCIYTRSIKGVLFVHQACTSCTSGAAFPDLSTCASHQVDWVLWCTSGDLPLASFNFVLLYFLKRTKRQKDQHESFILWRQGSFLFCTFCMFCTLLGYFARLSIIILLDF